MNSLRRRVRAARSDILVSRPEADLARDNVRSIFLAMG
jgi:hypothetical protein